MRFNVTLSVAEPGVPVFDDVMIAVAAALRDLGHTTVNAGGPDPDSVDVVFGHYVAAHRFPDTSVVYQLEPVSERTLRNNHVQPDMLRRNIVWDYSRHNVEQLRVRGVHAHYVPMGHHPLLERVVPVPEQDIDVLFYGSTTPRRRQTIAALRDAGLHTVHISGIWTDELDPIIARAKVVLNLHAQSEYRALESVRVGYLMTNRKAVVAEVGPADDDDELGDGIVGVPYRNLVDACVELVRDDAARVRLEAAAWDVISRRPMTGVLDGVLHTAAGLDLPVGAWGPRFG